jgi:hypothetical protein
MAAIKIPDDIRYYLVNTVALSNPVTLYQLAPTPIIQYAVIEYNGIPRTRVHGSTSTGNDIAFDEAMIQIQSRHNSIETARNNLKAIVDAIDGLMDTTIQGNFYTYIQLISPIRLFEVEETGAAVFICEFHVQARRS